MVVELIGGSDGPALTLARRTLVAGKPLVTANKAMLAHHGLELAEAAEKAGQGTTKVDPMAPGQADGSQESTAEMTNRQQ